MYIYASETTSFNYHGKEISTEGAVGMRLKDWLDREDLDIEDIEIPSRPFVLYRTKDLMANYNSRIAHISYDSPGHIISVSVKNPKFS